MSDELRDDLTKFRGVTQDVIDELNQLRDNRDRTYNFWRLLKKADYLQIDVNGDGTFREFLEANYGVKLYVDDAGQYLSNFDIVDEQKHLMFELKYR